MNKFIKEYKDWKKSIIIYDIDDTLIQSTASVTIYDKKTKKTTVYSTLEYSKIDRLPHYDIGMF